MAAIDAKDLEILGLLQADGRLSNRRLAETIGLSESACLARLRRLERSGVIRGYYAAIAPEALGDRMTIYAEVTLAHHRATDFALFDRMLAAIPEIIEAAQVSGPADYVLKAVVRDMDAWRGISDVMLDKEISIENVRTTVVMKVAKHFPGPPVPGVKAGR